MPPPPSLPGRRPLLALCALLGVAGLALASIELGLALAGWLALCVVVGALFAAAAFYAVVGCVVAGVVCLLPWTVSRADALAPERFGGAALDAVVWLARAFAGFAWRSLGDVVRPEVTPAVATGLGLMAIAATTAALFARLPPAGPPGTQRP
jgi:hypothetical protein